MEEQTATLLDRCKRALDELLRRHTAAAAVGTEPRLESAERAERKRNKSQLEKPWRSRKRARQRVRGRWVNERKEAGR